MMLAFWLVISACSQTDSDARRVFATAFSMQAPPSGVMPLNGYRLERRRWFVMSEEMWRLHLAGPDAKQFVRQQWPDLRLGNPQVFLQGSQTPWFAPGRHVKYSTFISRSRPEITVMQTEESDEVFIAYDAL
jgi:hypothetical protein